MSCWHFHIRGAVVGLLTILQDTCATDLVAGGIAGGCGEEDVACFCRNETIVINFRDCVYAECPVEEAGEGVVAAYTVCAGKVIVCM